MSFSFDFNPCPTRRVRHAVTDVPAPALTAQNRNRSDPRKALGENSPHPQMSRVRVRLFRGFLRAISILDTRRSGLFSAVIRYRPLSANLRDRCGVRWQSQVRASSKITCFVRIHLKGNRDDREHMKSSQSINWAWGQPPAPLNPGPAVPPCRQTPPGSETKLDHVYIS